MSACLPRKTEEDLPFDGEASDSGLLGENIALDSLDDGLGGRVVVQFLAVVLVVDIVANAHEFATIVGASEKDDGNAENLRGGQSRQIGWIGFEDEFIDADRDRTDEQGVQLLIVLSGGG